MRIVGIDTVPMTDEEYQAAVEALAVLIAAWKAADATDQGIGSAHPPAVGGRVPTVPAEPDRSPT